MSLIVIANCSDDDKSSTPPDPCLTTHANNLVCYVTPATYTAPDSPPSGFTAWEGAGGALEASQTPEYKEDGGGADRIGAAYAHARGHTGRNVIVSTMGGSIALSHYEFDDIDSDNDGVDEIIKTVRGYDGLNELITGLPGRCTQANNCIGEEEYSHFASIIVAKSGNVGADPDNPEGPVQGIAYDAGIKPVDILAFAGGTGVISIVEESKLIKAIGRASGMTAYTGGSIVPTTHVSSDDDPSTITVMNNGWDVSVADTYIEGDTTFHYEKASELNLPTITQNERDAWKAAVADANTGRTVVVFAQGDYGFNSENGLVRLYSNAKRGYPYQRYD